MIGYALTGSFCTIKRSLQILDELLINNQIQPIVSGTVANTDTRFGKAEDTLRYLSEKCGRAPITTIAEAEPLGPRLPLDALIICPCTGNTLAKMANGITDTSVTMAAKAHLRNQRPLILAIATNDGLSQSLSNIAVMLNKKNVYIVPFGQDDPTGKPCSLISDMSLVKATLEQAMQGKQIQPILIR